MDMFLNFDGPNSESCLIKNHNSTFLPNVYEGIPQTLILNLVAWIFLIILFTLLRQQAWDYGRLALVNGGKKRWTQLFYAHGGTEDFIETSERTATINTNLDRGLLSWIWITLKLKKEQIKEHSGPDAFHYLSFQQHLMVVMSIITLISIVVILPTNYQGTLSGDDINSFGHTTLSNLEPDSPLLWIHVIVAICFVPLIVLIMRRSSGRNAGKRAPTRTIMATNISQNDCDVQAIKTYIQQLFPDINITDIQLAYNIKELSEITNEYERTYEARVFCEQHRNHIPVQIRPNCLKCNTIDALEYYQDKENQLQGEVARLRARSLNEPVGIAFISVRTTEQAQNVIFHFKPGTYRDWTLTYAPAPSDLFWENLTNNTGQWYLIWIIVNVLLFIVLFFLTTPLIIVNTLDTLSMSKKATNQISKVSPVLSEFLPTLLLWTLSAVMPVIVEYSEKWLAHWTRSKQNYAIMTKSFGYLLFMVLILPSLGLTSAQALLEWTAHYSQNNTYRWECIFLPDKGAFFVNYVITASFIGTALELLRFPELIVYIWQICRAKSRAEHPHIRKSILIEFPFGIHYAWTIMIFTLSTVYSLACPLIMPFAMIYILMKHFVDRHNLYFAYGPSNMISQGGGKIHSTAVTITKVSVIVLLIIMAALASVRAAGVDARAVVLILALCITIILFTLMSPIKKCTTKPIIISDYDGPTPIYISEVLNKQIQRDSPINFGYGSDSVETINEAHNTIRRTVST